MLNKLFFTSCIITFFIISGAFALTASSENYSVSMFSTGIAVGSSSSENYQTIFLSESKGTTRNAESESLFVNIGFFDDVSYYRTVNINSYSINPKKAAVGSPIGLYISASNYQSVWAKIIAPNKQEQILSLINEQTINFVPSPSIIGTYQVIFYANSSGGAITSVIDYFELTEQANPPQSNSGGGSETKKIIEKCSYIWDCTPWSICFNGKQTRTCKNVGTCIGNESKPIEEIKCSEALFDISIMLKDIIVTENKSLKFNLSLIEQFGVEKIDVHIKYSIINKSNYEIFSQIETIAVEKNLTFDKSFEGMNLEDGEYILRVDVLYGNLQRAFAEKKFRVFYELIEREGSEDIQNKGKIFNSRKTLTGKIAYELSSDKSRMALTYFAIILVVVLLLILGRGIISIFKRIYRQLYLVCIKSKYVKNSVLYLIGKKVYSESGNYIGRVRDVILGENKIEGIKIEIDKKYNFSRKGVLISYKYVKGVSEIVIVNEVVLENIHFSKI